MPNHTKRVVVLGRMLGRFAVVSSQLVPGCSAGADEDASEKTVRKSDPVPEPEMGCSDNSDCQDEQACNDGRCMGVSLVAGCEPACDEGFLCSSSGNRCIPEGTCLTGDDCEAGLECVNNVCGIGGECGQREFAIAGLPPNVMLAVDRSGSMAGRINGDSRWELAEAAVNTILDEFGEIVNFGYMPFPRCDPAYGECAEPVIHKPIGSPIEEIRQAVAGTGLCKRELGGGTTLGGSLGALIGESTLQAEGRDNAVILLTDGAETCGGHAEIEALRLRAQDTQVKTYVVGFTDEVSVRALNEIAESGGTSEYTQADTGMELVEALRAIVGNVATCTYALEEAAPAQGLWIFFNKDPEPLTANTKDGWYLDTTSNTIEFAGAACEAIKGGDVSAIDVIFACEQPVPK